MAYTRSTLFLLMVVFVIEGMVATEEFDLIKRADPSPDYKPIGCFKDQYNERALPTLYLNLRLDEVFQTLPPDYPQIVRMCAEKAKSKGFQYFGVQYYAECWGGKKDGQWRYDMHGRADDDLCYEGMVGKDFTNMVYEVQGCFLGNDHYPTGSVMPWDDSNPCMQCKCSADGQRVCHITQCTPPGGSYCEKNVTTPGECCPHCACTHNGQAMQDGDSWVTESEEGDCFECTCREGEAQCPSLSCQDCEHVPEKCCPECGPGELVVTPTAMPVPTFPFPLPDDEK